MTDDPSRPEWPEPSDADRANLDKLSAALAAGSAALMVVRRRSDGAPFAAVCAIGTDLAVTPVAVMVAGNPFALFDPPAYCAARESGPPVVASDVCPVCGADDLGTLETIPGVALGRVEEGRFVPAGQTEIDWNGAETVRSRLGTTLVCVACGANWIHPALAGEAEDYEASPAAIPFSVALDECLEIMARLKDGIDNHLGASPDKVTWGHAADAGRILGHLRHAAFVAGVGGEPPE